jgi:hypothetical protein
METVEDEETVFDETIIDETVFDETGDVGMEGTVFEMGDLEINLKEEEQVNLNGI